MQLVPHKKFGQNWPTHESLHKIHLGRAFQPISHHFYGICCYLKLADTIARYKNRNLKPKNRIGRLKNRNSKRTDTIGRYKNRNLRPRNRIGRLKNRNSKRTDTIGRYKNRNLASTDCIVRYNRKIESVSENRSIGPFAHLCLPLTPWEKGFLTHCIADYPVVWLGNHSGNHFAAGFTPQKASLSTLLKNRRQNMQDLTITLKVESNKK
jgi:hypothetical protein